MKSDLRRLVVVATPAYFAWEMLQTPAFTGVPSSRVVATVFCALATAGDVVLVAGLFAAGVWLFGDRRWFAPPRLRRYAVIILLGVMIQVVVEAVAVDALGLWGYREWQPRLPLVGTGLVAVLQPVVLLPLTFGVLAHWHRLVGDRHPDRAPR